MEKQITPYIPTVGLEIHTELKTATKMFCSCINDPEKGLPNEHICPICMGHPGTLPHPNREAVQKVLMVGAAVGASLSTYSKFDRKNYFYPDIPKGYQISQHEFPFVKNGSLAGVAITRIHLEEDTARSQHDKGFESLVDYNRAGVPLMELVTEPVIHDAETAGRFARELQLLLRTLKVSDANMEKGEMRVEANISISRDGALGTKVEVKNLNSFRAVEGAITYEIARQSEVLESGKQVIQETRGWDENTRTTFSQRKKESSHDYRYFKDPDMPSMDLSRVDGFNISRLNEIMPELPSKTRDIYHNLGLTSIQSDTLLSNADLRSFFDLLRSCENDPAVLKVAVNYLTSDIVGLLATGRQIEVSEEIIGNFLQLVRMTVEKNITSRVAKDLLPEVVFEAKSPVTLVAERGLGLDASDDAISAVVETVVALNPAVVAEVKAGKEAGLKFLIGQGMKLSKGKAEPTLLSEMLKRRIDEM